MLPGVMGAKDEKDQLVDGYSSSGHKLNTAEEKNYVRSIDTDLVDKKDDL